MSAALLPVDAPDVATMPAADLVGLWARVLVRARGLSVADVEAFAGRLVEAARDVSARGGSGEITGGRGGEPDPGHTR